MAEKTYTREHESFEDFRDKELIYGALEAARLFAQRTDPINGVIQLITRARDHRIVELRNTYEDQRKGWTTTEGS